MSEQQNQTGTAGGQSEFSGLVICTVERAVRIDGKTICSWRKVINREDNKPVAIIDINYTDFIESRSWDLLTKHDAQVIAKAMTMLVEDINAAGV